MQRTELTDVADNESTTIIKQRPVRFKSPKTVAASVPDVRRQKIDLKGPRVKHVCRSASIVLGQPLATFNDEKKAIGNESQVAEPIKTVDGGKGEKAAVPVASKSDTSSSYSENESSDCDRIAKILETNMSSLKRERSQKSAAIEVS